MLYYQFDTIHKQLEKRFIVAAELVPLILEEKLFIGTMEEQVYRVLIILKFSDKYGSLLSGVLKATIFTQDMNSMTIGKKVYKQYCPNHKPNCIKATFKYISKIRKRHMEFICVDYNPYQISNLIK